jgi:hypothetical protein
VVLTGFQLGVTGSGGAVPVAAAFGVRPTSSPMPATPFFVAYASDAGPNFTAADAAGPIVEAVTDIVLREIPTGTWISGALGIEIASGRVNLSLGATHATFASTMALDRWDRRTGSILLGVHAYPTTGEAAVRFDDLVFDVDGPCP